MRLPSMTSRLSFIAFALFLNAALAQQAAPAPTSITPTAITLEQAIALARANEPSFAAAAANKHVTALDHSIAQAALLPGVSYHNQVLYTQPNGATNGGGPVGSQAAPRFIANNAVREYASQGVVTETFGLQQLNAVSRASAADAVAAAELEIARRGATHATAGERAGRGPCRRSEGPAATTAARSRFG
jgi:outer membrane protein TolC